MEKATPAEIFSKNLNRYLEKSRRTQKEIAEAVGVSPAAFNWWVKGNRYPRMDKVEMLAEYFGCALVDLVGDTEEQDRLSKTECTSHSAAILEIIEICKNDHRIEEMLLGIARLMEEKFHEHKR